MNTRRTPMPASNIDASDLFRSQPQCNQPTMLSMLMDLRDYLSDNNSMLVATLARLHEHLGITPEVASSTPVPVKECNGVTMKSVIGDINYYIEENRQLIRAINKVEGTLI